ncbi:MAG TPA: triose-phosphate isomerase [Rickettsiales bacterium]|nr:triose-phosphate isomerase [Rickettsiales bacterium]
MKKIIVANWKMNHGFDESDSWVVEFIKLYENEKVLLKNLEAIICPPAILIDNMSASLMDYSFEKIETEIAKAGKQVDDFSEDELAHFVLEERPFAVGAQDCHFAESGSFTGDISVGNLLEVGAEFVIVGHSERRSKHFESDGIIAQKIKTIAAKGLTPILCVGESKEQRDLGKHLEFVYHQILRSIPKDIHLERLIIAYEPIWAIGSGIVPTQAQIVEMAKLIKRICVEKIAKVANEFALLYGGSVSTKNAKEILTIANVDGLLVGGASLDASGFFEICKQVL